MTTQIQPGDLVLRDGRAEEVLTLLPRRYPEEAQKYAIKGVPAFDAPMIADATRIGSTRDGWRVHDGNERPEGVGAEDRVEVCWAHRRGRGEYRAGSNLSWAHVAAYRVLPAEPDRDAEVTFSGSPEQVANHLRGLVRDAEVIKVAAELRAMAGVYNGDWYVRLRALADRLDPPVFKALKVGDRVRRLPNGQVTGDVFGVHGSTVAVAWRAGSKVVCATHELERIP